MFLRTKRRREKRRAVLIRERESGPAQLLQHNGNIVASARFLHPHCSSCGSSLNAPPVLQAQTSTSAESIVVAGSPPIYGREIEARGSEEDGTTESYGSLRVRLDVPSVAVTKRRSSLVRLCE